MLPKMESHAAAIKSIAATVRAFASSGRRFRIYHGSSNTTRPAHDEPVVDISSLNNILSIDASAAIAVLEPNVPMDRLVRATIPHGLIPPVVMEFPGITAVGLQARPGRAVPSDTATLTRQSSPSR